MKQFVKEIGSAVEKQWHTYVVYTCKINSTYYSIFDYNQMYTLAITTSENRSVL